MRCLEKSFSLCCSSFIWTLQLWEPIQPFTSIFPRWAKFSRSDRRAKPSRFRDSSAKEKRLLAFPPRLMEFGVCAWLSSELWATRKCKISSIQLLLKGPTGSRTGFSYCPFGVICCHFCHHFPSDFLHHWWFWKIVPYFPNEIHSNIHKEVVTAGVLATAAWMFLLRF